MTMMETLKSRHLFAELVSSESSSLTELRKTTKTPVKMTTITTYTRGFTVLELLWNDQMYADRAAQEATHSIATSKVAMPAKLMKQNMWSPARNETRHNVNWRSPIGQPFRSVNTNCLPEL
mmetsp:Transcript_3407/g.9065  ORF Transcript_3407/g.9065 Transcript_3407/m.9065 type:complete len:121 (-) Transcript_3407:43-405(-)